MNTATITRSDEILGGIPVFTCTRVPVQNLFDYLTGGETIDEFLDDFPSVSREQVIAVLEIAGDTLLTLTHPNPPFPAYNMKKR
jgi:uncharacterized protein (DUF433 family)